MTVFWDVAPCSLVDTDRRFREAKYLNYQGEDGGSKLLWTRLDGATSQKTATSYLPWESQMSLDENSFSGSGIVTYGQMDRRTGITKLIRDKTKTYI
jgi:hypothetical protein